MASSSHDQNAPGWETGQIPVEVPPIGEISKVWTDSFDIQYGNGTKKIMVGANWCLRQMQPFGTQHERFQWYDLKGITVAENVLLEGTLRALHALHFEHMHPSRGSFVAISETVATTIEEQELPGVVEDPEQLFLVPSPNKGTTLFLSDVA